MTPIITVNERNFPAGTDNLPSTAVPDGATRILISATRVNWQDTGSEVVLLSLEVSLDGGTNWSFLCSVGDYGGNPISPQTGLPKTHTRFNVPLPPGTGRLVRGTVTLAVALRSAISVEVE